MFPILAGDKIAMIQSKANNIFNKIKTKFYSTLNYDYELSKLIDLFDKYSPQEKKQYKVLDVGCGYGKKLKALHEEGYNVLGIDANPKLVQANRANGLKCLTLEEFSQNSEQFDLILMSHLIEHFNPDDLKNFIDSYLDKLKIGGYLIIATPLITSYFYDDFDHIKPYSPHGIMMVFGDNYYSDQVQYYSRNKLELQDIWFRKRHYRTQFFKGKYIKDKSTFFLQLIDFCSILLFRSSLGIVGKTDGWIGIFQKVKTLDS
jgi:SAM-dependent methyltransferase